MKPWLCSTKNIVFVAKSFRLRFLFVLLVVLIGFSASTFAQQATIVGTVTDPSGAVVPNVTITVTNTDTSAVHKIQTNESGQFVVPDLVWATTASRPKPRASKLPSRKTSRL